MAKGFGGIMAEAAMAIRKAELKGNPACPICGEPMVGNGVVWSCLTSHADYLESVKEQAYEANQDGQIVFTVDLRTPPLLAPTTGIPACNGCSSP